ncbi:sugar phosphate isomerase/epimerase family protein [Agilicoccus flavus]|uniref:sugar phosphate isomerase/epimerase family protein n=1 Tax=Agilicoccus flavus TaxID=2775968 RepID=UPI001CF60BFF|nr:sugar phosphate isomerase/epimerase [Agilicoccus flavus]
MRTPLADRVGLSTISFRFRPLEEALDIIGSLGAVEVDLGAIPAVTDHVPVPFAGDPATYVKALDRHGLRCGAVNSDVGDLNDPALTPEALRGIARPLIDLAAATGGALIVPCGRAAYEPFVDEAGDLARIAENLRLLSSWCEQSGVRLLVEVLHHRRFVHSVEAADRLLAAVGPDVFGLLLDVSHVVASGDDPVEWAGRLGSRVERVHLRDAVPGDLNVGIGRGDADFAGVIGALEAGGFEGTYILELETHDVQESEREADADRSRREIVALLERARS